ncbi:MAG: zinc-binding dehydrogenase [[Ruminococcus] lactaris]|uniref:zinc-binding dehydrogenase n=1 Tax=[Ruminococcus] lactaris TaxID=46228 RepID=UPI0039A1472A
MGTRKDEERLQKALELGADKVMYVEDEDIAAQVKSYCRGIGADAVFECSGAVPAIRLTMDLMRKGAHYTQVGIPSKDAPIDMGKVVLREYTIAGTYATRPIWWDKTIELLNDGKIDLKSLMSTAYPLDMWEKGFDEAVRGEGFKHIIVPNS